MKPILGSAVVTGVALRERSSRSYLLGAHYDSLSGTADADDDSSTAAVQLEAAKISSTLEEAEDLKIVSFAHEEPPAFLTRYPGNRVHARKARRINCISLLWQSS